MPYVYCPTCWPNWFSNKLELNLNVPLLVCSMLPFSRSSGPPIIYSLILSFSSLVTAIISLFPDIVTLNSPCLILLLCHNAEGISYMVFSCMPPTVTAVCSPSAPPAPTTI